MNSAQYNNYYLLKFEIPQPYKNKKRKIDGLDDKKITIATWIERSLQNEPRSNFLFPGKMDGPDLMFFLSNSGIKVLCAAQVRDLEVHSSNRY
jgi:hypothetical protein